MDLSGFESKQELLSFIQQNPQMIAFEGWDRYGQPKLTDAGQKHTWLSAMKTKFYDKDVENALLWASNTMRGSAQERGLGGEKATTEYSRPQMRFTPEITELPAQPQGLARFFQK